MSDVVRAIETCAFDAWPAEEVVALGPWRLRATRGVTRRANSVWTAGLPVPRPGFPGETLDTAVARVEAFYGERGLPVLFQLSPLVSPPDLDGALQARGYLEEAPVSVQVAPVSRVLAATAGAGGAGLKLVIQPELFPAWFDLSTRRGRFVEAAEIYQGLLARLRGRAVYALAERAGEPVAVALGVRDGRWMGIFSMATAAAHRRQGAARALLGALAQHARTEGHTELYLQVERENLPAQALYTASGFTESHRYHYRRRP